MNNYKRVFFYKLDPEVRSHVVCTCVLQCLFMFISDDRVGCTYFIYKMALAMFWIIESSLHLWYNQVLISPTNWYKAQSKGVSVCGMKEKMQFDSNVAAFVLLLSCFTHICFETIVNVLSYSFYTRYHFLAQFLQMWPPLKSAKSALLWC